LQVWLGAHVPWGNKARHGAYGRAGYGQRQVSFSMKDATLDPQIDDETCGHWL
jgi:hypothetical protein